MLGLGLRMSGQVPHYGSLTVSSGEDILVDDGFELQLPKVMTKANEETFLGTTHFGDKK